MSVMDDSGGVSQPRRRRRLGAAVALGVCAVLWLLGLGAAGDALGIVWGVSGLLTCLLGLAVAIGRARVRRGDTWQAAFVAAPVSLLGPLSATLLLVPPVRRSLREVPLQMRARAEELEALGHTPDQAAVAYRRGASVALGLVAATLAFLSSAIIGVWLAFASNTLVGGDGVAFGLGMALIVGMAGFVGVLIAQFWQWALVGLELTAAAVMVAAIVGVAVDGGVLHWQDGSRVSVSFLYWLWALVAILFLWGAAMAWRRPGT
jgi:hypothetical protein